MSGKSFLGHTQFFSNAKPKNIIKEQSKANMWSIAKTLLSSNSIAFSRTYLHLIIPGLDARPRPKIEPNPLVPHNPLQNPFLRNPFFRRTKVAAKSAPIGSLTCRSGDDDRLVRLDHRRRPGEDVQRRLSTFHPARSLSAEKNSRGYRRRLVRKGDGSGAGTRPRECLLGVGGWFCLLAVRERVRMFVRWSN